MDDAAAYAEKAERTMYTTNRNPKNLIVLFLFSQVAESVNANGNGFASLR